MELLTKAKPLFTWEAATHRFRRSNGTFVSPDDLRALRESYLEQEKALNVKLAQRLFNREIDLTQWQKEMRDSLKRTYTTQYLLGIGGKQQMTPGDYGLIGNRLRPQYKFLRQFARSIQNGEYTVDQVASVAARQQLYAMSSNQMYERARAKSWRVKLPAYPGDGSSDCLTNCKCSWEIVEEKGKVKAYWRLSSAEHCPTCTNRAGQWNPLVIE